MCEKSKRCRKSVSNEENDLIIENANDVSLVLNVVSENCEGLGSENIASVVAENKVTIATDNNTDVVNVSSADFSHEKDVAESDVVMSRGRNSSINFCYFI